MKKRLFYIGFLLFTLTTSQARFGELPDEQISVSFSSPYPTSSLKRIKILATQLWAEVNAGIEDVSARDNIEDSIVDFAHTVLDLHTLCDSLVQEVHGQLNGMSVRYQRKNTQKTLEEMRYLTDLIGSLENTFDQVMDGHVSDQAACVKVVLDCIRKKMERTLLSAP